MKATDIKSTKSQLSRLVAVKRVKVELLVSRGCYSYSSDYGQRLEGHAGGAVEIPCPQADRFRKRALKKRRERRRRAKAARERRAKEKRARSRRLAKARRTRRRRSRRRSRGRGRQRRRRRRRSTRSRRRRSGGRGREQLPREIDALRMTTNVTDVAKQPIPTKSCSGCSLLQPNDRPRNSDHSTISADSGKKQE
ncbi:hypothetical protein K0M31_019673 [Melipona bicolor]|uniref:Uncharacterized protein n=1 Tax=Melipona bicolor TaxID=60889 RepID=A0AA40G388_9HYME|nr:hypothetical protein K0M31_019673 [Melipona bicolor]